MTRIAFALLGAAVMFAAPTFAAGPEIPREYRGTWCENSARPFLERCRPSRRKFDDDQQVRISANTYKYYLGDCLLVKVGKPGVPLAGEMLDYVLTFKCWDDMQPLKESTFLFSYMARTNEPPRIYIEAVKP